MPADACPATPGRKPWRAEQLLEVLGGLADPRRRHADVLDDHRHARPAHRGEQPLHALAHVPEHLDLARARGVKRGGSIGERAARISSAARSGASSSRGVLGAELDEQRGRGGRQLLPALGRPGHVPGGGDQRRGDHQLGRARAARRRARAPRRRRCRCPRRSDSESVVWRPSGTVSKTASPMNASVPSEPISRRRKISSGSSASRNAHRR